MKNRLPQEIIDQCWAVLRAHAPKSLAWNHYDLAVETEIDDTELWKAFLSQPRLVRLMTMMRIKLVKMKCEL